MYSINAFEHLFIRYQAEAMPQGKSIQAFCLKTKYSTICLRGGIRTLDITFCPCIGIRTRGTGYGKTPFGCRSICGNILVIPPSENHDKYLSEHWDVYTATERV